MAKKGNGTAVHQDETFRVVDHRSFKPSELQFRDSELVGRSRPVADEDVFALAESMDVRAGGVGQQQPVQVRLNNGVPEIIFGNTRKRAGELIEKGYKSISKNSKGNFVEYPPNPDFTLRCEIVEVDDATAFKRNVVENVRRNATSPVDNAVNQQILREKYSMSDVAIARLYGYASSASVHRLKKLLNLPADILDMVHDGRCTLQAANDLEEFLSKEGPEAFSNLWNTIHKPAENETDAEKLGSTVYTAEIVRDAIKAWKAAKKEAAKASGEQPANGQPTGDSGTVPPVGEGASTGGTTPAPATSGSGEKSKGLSSKQIKDILRGMFGERKKVPQIYQDFASHFLVVCEGGDLAEFVAWVRSCGTAEEIAMWDGWDAEKQVAAEAAGPVTEGAEAEQPVEA